MPTPARLLTRVASALVLLGVATVPAFSPPWLAFGQDQAEVPARTGLDRSTIAEVTGSLVGDLLVGPPDFDVEVAGDPVLREDERAHLRDVRGVVLGFLGLCALAGGWLWWRRRSAVSGADRIAALAAWRADVDVGARGLAVGLVVTGLVAVVAFEPAFELFHRILFSGGNWAFDPAKDRLVQLFPETFWQLTSLFVGAIAVGLAVLTVRLDRRPR